MSKNLNFWAYLTKNALNLLILLSLLTLERPMKTQKFCNEELQTTDNFFWKILRYESVKKRDFWAKNGQKWQSQKILVEFFFWSESIQNALKRI